MTRIARAIAPEFPHHVVQRGNNKSNIFIDEQDFKTYLELIARHAERSKSGILAYCIMTNHAHLLVKPPETVSLPSMMHGLGQGYALHVHKKYQKTGRLWENRYFSSIVDHEAYLWAVVRYIEQNPVRAKIVTKAEDYPYSSAKAHINGEPDQLLSEAIFDESERKEYIKFVREDTSHEGIKFIQASTRNGRPIGNEKFIRTMEVKLDRKFTGKLWS